MCGLFFFFFKQKTAYEMRISDWSSDVCSSDLAGCVATACEAVPVPRAARAAAVASSSSSRKLTIAVDGALAARSSKIIRGVVPAPYTAWLASSSIDSTAPSSATPTNSPPARDQDQKIGGAARRERVCQ